MSSKYPASTGWKSSDWQQWFSSLRGMAEARLDDLVAGKGDAAEHVHEIRKILKRLRAGARMLKGIMDSDACGSVQKALREAGRLLSGSRDQTVRLATFRSLIGESGSGGPKSVASARARLEKEAIQAREIADDQALEARRLVGNATLPKSLWKKVDRGGISQALGRLLKRSRMEYLDIVAGHSGEFHELRKRVKDLYYNLTALPEEAGDEVKPVTVRLKNLSDLLGEENDIAVLMEWFESEGLEEADTPRLWKPFRKRQKILRHEVIEAGDFLKDPSALGRL